MLDEVVKTVVAGQEEVSIPCVTVFQISYGQFECTL